MRLFRWWVIDDTRTAQLRSVSASTLTESTSPLATFSVSHPSQAQTSGSIFATDLAMLTTTEATLESSCLAYVQSSPALELWPILSPYAASLHTTMVDFTVAGISLRQALRGLFLKSSSLWIWSGRMSRVDTRLLSIRLRGGHRLELTWVEPDKVV